MDAKASGQPLLPDPATLREVVNNEDIIHRDDMVDFWFLSAGGARGEFGGEAVGTQVRGRCSCLRKQQGAPQVRNRLADYGSTRRHEPPYRQLP